MSSRKKYLRKFVILQSRNTIVSSENETKGHCKIEVRDGKGKITLNIEGLTHITEVDKIYKACLLTKNKKNVEKAEVGIIDIKENGKSKHELKFNPENVGNTGIPIEDFNTILVELATLEKDNEELTAPLVGYIEDQDDSLDIFIKKLKDKKVDESQEVEIESDDEVENEPELEPETEPEMEPETEEVHNIENLSDDKEDYHQEIDDEDDIEEIEEEQESIDEYEKEANGDIEEDNEEIVEELEEEKEYIENIEEDKEPKQNDNYEDDKEYEDNNKVELETSQIDENEMGEEDEEVEDIEKHQTSSQYNDINQYQEIDTYDEIEQEEVGEKENYEKKGSEKKEFREVDKDKESDKFIKIDGEEDDYYWNEEDEKEKQEIQDRKHDIKRENKNVGYNGHRDSLGYSLNENQRYASKERIYRQQVYKYTMNILKFFEKVNPIETELEGYEWWEIEYDKNNLYRGFLPYYNYIVGMYYPYPSMYKSATCQSLIKKYEHYLFGVARENREVKYYVYGMPGKHTRREHPYRGATGFTTWAKKKDENNKELGYWLLHIDPATGKAVSPLQSTRPR